MKQIKIGSAESEPGKINYGFIDGIELPTGGVERIPVIIAQGTKDGPTLFITANVHGNELTGIGIIYDVVTESLVAELSGTIVAIPTLNPSGLRLGTRHPEFDQKDPNRMYPAGMFEKPDDAIEEKDPPAPYEQIAEIVFSYFKKYADYHIDLHNYEFRSIPFSIIDRVFYKDESDLQAAEELSKKQIEMVEAFGLIVAVDFPPKKYVHLKYHRSVSGSVLNNLRIPAFTAELGANTVIMPEVVAGCVKGTRNVLRWAGMLGGQMEKITEFSTTQPTERIRRAAHPISKHSGLIRFLVKPGDEVVKGQPIATITDIFGRPLGDGHIRTEHDGYMINLQSKVVVYQHQPIAEMGIKDEYPIVVQKET